MKEELFILWTNDNLITSEKMVFMYGHNGLKKGWWKEVTIIIWGATSVLAAENPSIQSRMKEMMTDGVKFIACKSCADNLEVTDKLEALGVEVFYTGETLTGILKNEKSLLTI